MQNLRKKTGLATYSVTVRIQLKMTLAGTSGTVGTSGTARTSGTSGYTVYTLPNYH